jgi:hypothetical protein
VFVRVLYCTVPGTRVYRVQYCVSSCWQRFCNYRTTIFYTTATGTVLVENFDSDTNEMFAAFSINATDLSGPGGDPVPGTVPGTVPARAPGPRWLPTHLYHRSLLGSDGLPTVLYTLYNKQTNKEYS